MDQVVTLVNFLSIALDSKQLVAKVDAARAGGNAEIDLSLSEIVRGLLHISAVSVDQATPAESAEFASATSEALQSAVRLMSTQSFSEAIIWLLDLADPLIRSSALVLLRSRLPTIKAVRRQDVSPAVIAVVDRIQGSFDLAETDVESSLATLDVVATSVFPAEDAALAKTVPTLIEVASRVSVSNVSRSLILSIIKKLSYVLVNLVSLYLADSSMVGIDWVLVLFRWFRRLFLSPFKSFVKKLPVRPPHSSLRCLTHVATQVSSWPLDQSSQPRSKSSKDYSPPSRPSSADNSTTSSKHVSRRRS